MRPNASLTLLPPVVAPNKTRRSRILFPPGRKFVSDGKIPDGESGPEESGPEESGPEESGPEEEGNCDEQGSDAD
jgi:hypothetical protein